MSKYEVNIIEEPDGELERAIGKLLKYGQMAVVTESGSDSAAVMCPRVRASDGAKMFAVCIASLYEAAKEFDTGSGLYGEFVREVGRLLEEYTG